MTTLTEGPRAEEFVLSEAAGQLSRSNGVGGATLKAGAVVEVSASKLVSYDGSGTVVGVLLHDCVLDQPVAYLDYHAEVKGDYLTSTEQTSGEIEAGAIAGLLALKIKVR
ncbi:head decoration protein [Mesorhizobium sp. WSM4962]|uniref:head decoration protein n=1 Tax=Mesorhizobium sp. WSM4962 TaxID=3038548 RepID=UPI002417A3CA|nr:head decoration protein [Mesorhizobium sp. WSM4962]MDG4903200.1 head decoration protein [Mesorhizobium sp. WSM4962]